MSTVLPLSQAREHTMQCYQNNLIWIIKESAYREENPFANGKPVNEAVRAKVLL